MISSSFTDHNWRWTLGLKEWRLHENWNVLVFHNRIWPMESDPPKNIQPYLFSYFQFRNKYIAFLQYYKYWMIFNIYIFLKTRDFNLQISPIQILKLNDDKSKQIFQIMGLDTSFIMVSTTYGDAEVKSRINFFEKTETKCWVHIIRNFIVQ